MPTDLYPKDLIDQLQSGSVTPFIGSGFSIPSGVPSWLSLLNGLVDELGEHPIAAEIRELLDDGDLSSIAAPALYKLLSSEFALRQYVQQRLGQPWKPNQYHAALASLPSDVVITTNWDNLIERTYEDAGINIHKIWTDAHLAHFNARQSVQVIKIHGTLDDISSIVFTQDQYENYRSGHKYLYNFLSNSMLTETFLFLGFSLNDPNVRSLLEAIASDLEGIPRQHYAVLTEPDRATKETLKRLGVHVINVPENGDRTRALVQWLNGLVERSRIIGIGNKQKATTINSLLDRQITTGVPGATIRMRAALGILSNPRTANPADPLYTTAEQDKLEIDMGEKGRRFLSLDPRNEVRCILHINPDHQRQKGYQWRHLKLRFEAMLEFLDVFGPQISIAHSPIPVDMNQVIIGRAWAVTSFKRGEAVGYERLTVTANRWVVDADIRGFDHDFDGIRLLNRQMAETIGIDTADPQWHHVLSRRILELAIAATTKPRVVLHCDEEGKVIGPMSREEAHAKGTLHRSVHLHVVDASSGKNRVLVQRRPKSSDLYGGLLDVSVSGHPELDDSVAEVRREAHEELGIDIPSDQIRFVARRPRTYGSDSEIVDVYYASRPGLADDARLTVTRDVDAIHWIEPENSDGTSLVARGLLRYGSLHIPTASTVRIADFVPGAFDEVLEVLRLTSTPSNS